MSMLLHACCGPCAMYPVDMLLEQGTNLDLYWYNPNIHPEFETYLAEFGSRCHMCYDIRMDAAARYAAENGYDSFCTTLLVSPYQQHDVIVKTCEQKAEQYGVGFEYIDFRPGFRQGQNMARDIGLYRQKYCGCIFSLESSEFRDKIYKSFGSC